MEVPVTLDFLAVSSYGKGKTSSGEVQLTKDLDASLAGRDVILVEDIADTGLTLNYLLNMLRSREPATLKVAAFLSKPSRREIDVPGRLCRLRSPRSLRRWLRPRRQPTLPRTTVYSCTRLSQLRTCRNARVAGSRQHGRQASTRSSQPHRPDLSNALGNSSLVFIVSFVPLVLTM